MSNSVHIDRIPVDMTVDEHGNIAWNPIYRDYNETVFHRGKTVTNDEFNDLHKKSTYQGNYLTDSLKALFGEHLNSAIIRNITTHTNSVRSYVKPFVSTDWGELQQDGYYYISIPATTHGFIINSELSELERMGIKVQMYLLDSNNNFYEVQQVEIDTQNNVTIYTDDNTLSGFVIIGINDKTYTLIDENINANLITGLANVAISGDYNDLINTPDARITALENAVTALTGGTTVVTKATQADIADRLLSTSLIQGVTVSSIFETGSSYVKNATNATKVQGVDFSASTPAQVGEYIISKKKLLYSWENGFEINNTTQAIKKNNMYQDNVYVDYSKIIEIVVAPYEPHAPNYRYLRFKLQRVNSTAPLQLVCCAEYNDNVFSWYTLELNIINATYPTRALTVKCQYYQYNTTTNTISTFGVNSRLYLYAIYEITE